MSSRFSNQLLSSQHNLKMWKENGHRRVLKYSSMIIQKFSKVKCFKDFQELIKSKKLLKLLFSPKSDNEEKNVLFKVWAHHCECVLAQRIRRCQQMFSLYSAWWEECVFREFTPNMRQSCKKKQRFYIICNRSLHL